MAAVSRLAHAIAVREWRVPAWAVERQARTVPGKPGRRRSTETVAVGQRRVTAGKRREAAFTLVEVMVAASLLLLTVTCVTPLLTGSLSAGHRSGRGDEAGRIAESRLEFLRSLPFAPPRPLSPSEAPPGACVVGEVFPHADPARNTDDAYVVLADTDDWPAGTFVTMHALPDGFTMTTGCRFAVAGADGLTPLAPVLLAGYEAADADELPSGVLLVTMVVTWREHGRERQVVRHATRVDESVEDAEDSLLDTEDPPLGAAP
jgi:type II secretory pathway pseudopilin PulG